MGEYDHRMKALVDSNPQAIARFVLSQWRKQKKIEMPEVTLQKVVQLSAEFEGKELEGDGVLLVEGSAEPLYLLEIEFQSALHRYMPLRSLEYLIKAKKKHWNAYGHLPVLSAVIYLFDVDKTEDFLESWPAPYELTSMVFHYLSISMKKLPRSELMALQEPTLWPLVLLADDGQVDRVLIQTMFQELLEHQLLLYFSELALEAGLEHF
jgi:hypothetical protein